MWYVQIQMLCYQWRLPAARSVRRPGLKDRARRNRARRGGGEPASRFVPQSEGIADEVAFRHAVEECAEGRAESGKEQQVVEHRGVDFPGRGEREEQQRLRMAP